MEFHRDVYLFEGVTGTEELCEALRQEGFQSLFVSQSQAWEASQRIDTSLLRAACWTMASGMRLERHVKAQCGETCKVDWCCEILSEVGVPCGLRFRSKKAWRCHQLRSRLHGHGLQTSIFAIDVITNSCPWCRSTFATTLIARKHAAAAMLSGHCRVDAGAFPWPISPPQSLLCRLCQDGDSYTSIDDFYDHAVAVHLPKPSPFSLPIVTALHHACGTRGTRRDTSCEGCDHGRGGEETTTNKSAAGERGSAPPNGEAEAGGRGDVVVPVGSKKKPAAFCKNTTPLMGIIIKQCLRTEQDTRSLCGALFDTIIMATEHDVVKSMREQTRLYNESVQTAGKGHPLGPPQIWAWGGLIAGLQKKGTAVGAANPVTLTSYLRQLDGMSMDAKCDHARFCRVDRTYQSEQARITLSVDRSGVRDSVVSALQQLGAARKYGRAPPTQLARELQQWLDTLLDKLGRTKLC